MLLNSKTEHKNINLGLERVLKLLEKLDNPHLKLPPVIHFAGTNGKGSTLAFMRALFTEAGLKVHCYTSPHLVRFNERIILAGKEISDQFLEECLNKCRQIVQQNSEIDPTFFEETTAAAFLAFSQTKADILLLETGLGGRLDATNVLPEVLASVITPIDFDHADFLGNTIEKIAAEKCGIIKKNCPVFVGKQRPEVLEIIEEKARKIGTEMITIENFEEMQARRLRSQDLSLAGEHQIDNAALAISCYHGVKEKLGVSLTEEQILRALKNTHWPARLEKITSGKYFKKLPKNHLLYLDGGHNLQAAEVINNFLKSQKNLRKIVIFAMMSDKDHRGFLEKISKEIDELIVLDFSEEERALKNSEIHQTAQKLGINSRITQNFDETFAVISQNKQPTLTLICGSLYLAGKFKKES